jgi:hypothetical protein
MQVTTRRTVREFLLSLTSCLPDLFPGRVTSVSASVPGWLDQIHEAVCCKQSMKPYRRERRGRGVENEVLIETLCGLGALCGKFRFASGCRPG